MPYLDGRAPIVPITKPMGSVTLGYKGWSSATLTQDFFYNIRPKGNSIYLTPDKRTRWTSPPNEKISRNTQVTEKPQITLEFYQVSFGAISIVTVLGRDKGKKYFMPSLISQQVASDLIPDSYDNSVTGSKDYITTHGKYTDSPTQFQQDQGGGSEVITNTYIKNGKENAFQESADGLTFTGKDLKKHSAKDEHYQGSTWAGLKKRGLMG